ncbi:MAG: beta-aspartyl-peptidase (threonine type) [Gammaproteobacteria bacterium]|jgi:beta-aspartyl-peptidase (threonine type)
MNRSAVAPDNAVLVIHGGAGVQPGHDYSQPAAFMSALLVRGGGRLRSGESALDLVVEMVAAMEESGLFTAGRGSAANQAGEVELDASLMTGHNCDAGAVAAVRNIVHPIRLARAVLHNSPHVMLAGSGAQAFARDQGLACVSEPRTYYRAAVDLTRIKDTSTDTGPLAHGTVGAVALDRNGQLAAATSTGGTLNKLPGRVGDTPLIGAATWADSRVAVSCTGQGEYFIRAAAAHDVAARMKYQRSGVATAAQAVIETVGHLGGEGGLIAVDAHGTVAMPFNSGGMKRGIVRFNGDPQVSVY